MKIPDDRQGKAAWDGIPVAAEGLWPPRSQMPISAIDADTPRMRRLFSNHRRRRDIDPHGYMRITEPFQDVIKSGGDGFSIGSGKPRVGHPAGRRAAVIAALIPNGTKLPLLIVRSAGQKARARTS